MFFPFPFIRSCTSFSWACCAATAPIPSSKAPATTTVRIIGQFPFNRASGSPSNLGYRESNPALDVSFLPNSQAMLALMLPDRDPDPLGSGRHVDMFDPVFAPQSVDNGIDHRRA